MNRPLRKSRLFIPGFLFPVLVLLVSPLAAQCQVRSLHQDNGPNAAAIQGAVEAFRADLGASNGAQPGSFPQGRREINWDRVPDNSASPNSLPADFFNTASPRGAILSTPGTGFEVSATADSGVPVRFGNRNAGYASEFSTFSAERLFTSIGSPITEVEFFIPGTSTPALVSGFGAIFSDSEREGSIVFFNPLGGAGLLDQ